MVIASLALVVALGGTSYAATVLPRNSVGTAQLRNNAVTSVKVKNGSLLKATSSPADPAGPTGPRRPAPGRQVRLEPQVRVRLLRFQNGPVAAPSTLSTVATLNIPQAGNYVVFAKLWMFDNVNYVRADRCTLVAGTDTDESRTMLEGNSGVVVAGAVVALNVTHDFTAAGAVALNCNGFGVNISINDIKITAIKVANLTNSGL